MREGLGPRGIWGLVQGVGLMGQVNTLMCGMASGGYPGGAFFQIGFGCVMSHHQSAHRRALHIPVVT